MDTMRIAWVPEYMPREPKSEAAITALHGYLLSDYYTFDNFYVAAAIASELNAATLGLAGYYVAIYKDK